MSIQFSSKRPFFSINGRDLSDSIREIGFVFKPDARSAERGMLDILPGPDRNVLEENIFSLTGGRATLIFREKNQAVSAANPQYRGLFNLSTRGLVSLNETVGAFGMDLAGALFKDEGDGGESEL